MSQPMYGMGLDLSKPDEITDEEIEAFREQFRTLTGRPHPGLNFWIEAGRADVLKRYRLFSDQITLATSGPKRWTPSVFGFLVQYAISGYESGIRYLVHAEQKLGLTKAQLLDGLAITFLYGGPQGMETVAEGLVDYEWIEPEKRAVFPDGWAADPDAFSSGIDFSSPVLTADERGRLEEWYLRVEGEVPRYVTFLADHRPELLKAYRNRFENAVRAMPKQVMPYVMIHVNAWRGVPDGIREGVLLARGFGMTKALTLEAISWGMFSGGPEAISLVDEAAGDVLAAWDE